MKNGTKVTHAYLLPNITVKSRPLNRNLFDGKEGMLGIRMELCPAGVLCRLGKDTFILPYGQCVSISIEEATETKKP